MQSEILTTAAAVGWESIDTVLLDMDGTLLDLAFDTHFWLEILPARWAEQRGVPVAAGREEVMSLSASVQGDLRWYCLDFWSERLAFDVAALKHNHRHLIAFLPGVLQCLKYLRARNKRLVIATNAHPRALEVKLRQTHLERYVDDVISSHEFACAKESGEFWARLPVRCSFDPQRTVLVEDSLAVVAAAAQYAGLRSIVIDQPDSRVAPRGLPGPGVIRGLSDLLPG